MNTQHHADPDFWTSENTETFEQFERDAYNSGDTVKAALIQAVIDLLQQVEKLEDVETLEQWEKKNGPASAYKEFFYECFERLSGHYPCPSVTSDYDKGVIFEAITRIEDLEEIEAAYNWAVEHHPDIIADYEAAQRMEK